MARYKQEEIDALREQADIVDVISHYIQVHRSGKSYKAICPFHDDHDPSLTINPEKKIYILSYKISKKFLLSKQWDVSQS